MSTWCLKVSGQRNNRIICQRPRYPLDCFPLPEIEPELQVRISNLYSIFMNEIAVIVDRADDIDVNEVSTTSHRSEGNLVSFLRSQDSIGSIIQRNAELKKRLLLSPTKVQLPIDKYESEILKVIEQNQVVVVEGGTGSGKSTRIPQMIFEKHLKDGNSYNCNIVVTEPRRISVSAIAERVATERNEPVGSVVGYARRLEQILPRQQGYILYVTAGILLRLFTCGISDMSISHIIIDEVHERDEIVDLVLLALKRNIWRKTNIKIIFMSATLDINIFRNYFGQCPVLEINTPSYNINTYHLEDFCNHLLNPHVINSKHVGTNIETIVDVVNYIHIKKPAGAILVFLPGWTEIQKVKDLIISDENSNNDLSVLAIHSRHRENYEAVFAPAPPNKRKVVLSTNIAETSITIPDVVYVVDSGLVNQKTLDNNGARLKSQRISKSAAIQRQGRAGRVQEGECYRLYTTEIYNEFSEYSPSHVQFSSLENFLASLLMLTGKNIESSLLELIEHPPKENIALAVKNLKSLGILDEENELTILGKRSCCLSAQPSLGLALIYSTIFRCLDPMVLALPFIFNEDELFESFIGRSERGDVLRLYNDTSDPMAIVNMFNSSAVDSRIKRSTLDIFSKIAEGLRNSVLDNFEGTKESYNIFSDTPFFVELILMMSSGNLAFQARGNIKIFNKDGGFKNVHMSPDSVNDGLNTLHCFLTYGRIVEQDNWNYISKTSLISYLCAFLFHEIQPNNIEQNETSELILHYDDLHVSFSTTMYEYRLIHTLRQLLVSMIHFYAKKKVQITQEDQKKVEHFMIDLLSIASVVIKL